MKLIIPIGQVLIVRSAGSQVVQYLAERKLFLQLNDSMSFIG